VKWQGEKEGAKGEIREDRLPRGEGKEEENNREK